MSKEMTIFILGILTAILPLSGFPTAWKKFMLVVFGLLIAYLAWHLVRLKKQNRNPLNSSSMSFIENREILKQKELSNEQSSDKVI